MSGRRIIEYIIRAWDKTKEGLSSALSNFKRHGAEVRQVVEDTNEESKKAAKDFQSGFSPMRMITAALSGNFQMLGQQVLGLVSKLKGVHMSMMQFSLYAALVMATVKAVQSLCDYFSKAAQRVEEIKLGNAESTLKAMKDDSSAFAASMERARKESEALFAAQNREVSALEELTKAYNAFAKAQELALAQTDEERKAIETRYKSTELHNAREISAEKRRYEREQLDAEIERMKEELEEAESDESDAAAQARHASSMAMKAARAYSTGSVSKFLHVGWFGTAGEDEKKNMERWEANRDAFMEEMLKAHNKADDLKRRIADAEHRREMLDEKEEAAQVRDMAEMQTELNEAWAEVDEEEKREIEEIKEAEIKAAEEVKEAEIKAAKEVKAMRMQDIRDLCAAESAAQQRLAEAQQAVSRAWGWYRNKDSLAAQLKEEKDDAAAREQYEKDFERLKFRRDWRTAKDLSLDDEAVRRVALAKEEEQAAQEYARQTAEASQRAADALEAIEVVLEEGEE